MPNQKIELQTDVMWASKRAVQVPGEGNNTLADAGDLTIQEICEQVGCSHSTYSIDR